MCELLVAMLAYDLADIRTEISGAYRLRLERVSWSVSWEVISLSSILAYAINLRQLLANFLQLLGPATL